MSEPPDANEADADAAGVSLREVAQRAGVAVSSASRVLADHPDVSARMRARVLAAASELGYEPNLLAQGLRRGASMTIGFSVRDSSNSLFSQVAVGAEATLREHGYTMLITNSEGLPELDATHARLFRQRRVDGVLLSLADEAYEPMLAELRRMRTPIVLIDRKLPADLRASSVLADHRIGLRRAVEHLIDLGHRSIAYLGGPLSLYPGREAADEMERIGRDAGVDVRIELGPFTPEFGAEATTRQIAGPSPATALVAGSNQILLGILAVARDRGLRVPDDLSIVTVDDIPFLQFLDPPMAVITVEPLTLGRKAADLLLDRIRGGEPATATVPRAFIARASCGPPPGRDRR